MITDRIYDNKDFFDKYSEMDRSKKGLDGAGEWETLEKMMPDMKGKKVLDLGCGYGWHCMYAVDRGAAEVVGLDASWRMLEVAREKSGEREIQYLCQSIEEADFPEESFDVVMSSLVFHYLPSFDEIAKKVNRWLKPGGAFVFSVEHPVFTSYGSQDWIYDEEGKILHFPVDRYFYEGEREAVFLGEKMKKYHRTLTTYLDGILQNGFVLVDLKEPKPAEHLMDIPGMKDELRRPMMLLLSAVKN